MSKFTWRINNFSKLGVEKHYSKTFDANGKKWRVLIYPKGNNTDHLSVYLEAANKASLPKVWQIPVSFRIFLVNQIHCNKSIKKESAHTFKSDKSDWGFTRFIPLNKLHHKTGGYIVNDTCVIEAEVYGVPSSIDKDSDTSAAIDPVIPVEPVYIQAQSLLESLPKPPSRTASNPAFEMPVLEGQGTSAKEIFDKLLSFRLDGFAHPKHETAMMGFLSKLTDQLHMFSDAQAKEIIKLKTTFPQIMQEWRDSVQVKGTSAHPWSTLEKTKSLLRDLVKTDEGLKRKAEDFKNKEMELEAQLQAIKNNSRQVQEEREEVSKQTEMVCSLAKEQASKVEAKEVEVDVANESLEERLKSKWAPKRMRHLFA